MDNLALKTLVEKSYLLSEPQRAFWLQQLPLLKADQRTKLEKTLAGSDELPFQKELDRYVLSLMHNAQSLSAEASAA